jgi:NAD+ synthase (glutamine-hydrolysing)
MLMALSNKYGSIVLTTGNKSEMAVGYCTLYGDMAGGFADQGYT